MGQTLSQPTKPVKKNKRRYRGKQSYPLPLWNGILEHAPRIGESLWELVWCIDKITKEVDGVGIVLGGAPVKMQQIADDLGFDKETVRRHVKRLADKKVIGTRRTPYGLVIEVLNSMKFGVWSPHRRSTQTAKEKPQTTVSKKPQNAVSLGGEKHIYEREKLQNAVSKEDAAITQQETHAANTPLPPKPGGRLEEIFTLPDWVPVERWNGFVNSRHRPMNHASKLAALELLRQFRDSGEDIAERLLFATANGTTLQSSPKKSKAPGSDTTQDHRDRLERNARAAGFGVVK
jgi:hypothetical protein